MMAELETTLEGMDLGPLLGQMCIRDSREPPGRSRPKPSPRQESPEQQFKRMERHCFRVLSDYHNLLRRWKRDYAPKTPDEEWHPLFVEALQKQSQSLIHIFSCRTKNTTYWYLPTLPVT